MLSSRTRLTIKPWFLDETLKKAEKLLEQRDSLVLHYRSACAIVFEGLEGSCLIHFAQAPQIHQGFRLNDTTCSICNQPQKSGDRCVHTAALTLKVLLEDGIKLTPAPLLFADSKWRQVSTFMNEQGTNLHVLQDDDNELQLSIQTENFAARMNLNKETRTLLPMLFTHSHLPENASLSLFHQESVQAAWKHLFGLCRSANEKSLNEAGRTSKGQEVERSLWTQLCQQFFLEQSEPDWELQRGSDNRISLLSSTTKGARLRLTPLRENTISLFKQIDAMNLITIKDSARAYSKIYFQKDDSLIIEPWIEMDNGEKYLRLDLKNFIFGQYCSIKGNLFQFIQEQEEDFSPKAAHHNHPLLAFAEPVPPDAPITILPEDVPAFLDKHLRKILNGKHDADPALKDFQINDLPDSISVESYSEDADWCYLSARYACGSRNLDLREILEMRRKGRKHAPGREKWLLVDNTPLDWLYNLAPERLQTDSEHSTLRLTRLEMMALTSLVPDLQLPEQIDKRQQIESLLKNLKSKDLSDADIPAHLRPYQRTGLAWLNHLYENGIGGILADDMGLGKTHQALALLELALRGGGGPALVVCPASVLPHWQDKMDTFYPSLDYTVYYGPQRTLSSLAASNILLTTYGIMRQDVELLVKYYFGLIIFDEVQHLKNRQNATSKAADRLKCRVCFGMSGTPIENSLTDLKSIYDLCLPGLLGGNSSFQRTYVSPIEEGQDSRRLEALQRLIEPFMLRRHKRSVLTELPDVIEDIRHCYLSPDQQTLYQQAIDLEGQELLATVNDPSVPFPHLGFLALVQQLKQICNHPCQLLKNSNYDKYSSGKWELFKEILDECLEAGLKVVVFSQYTVMLDIIIQYLQDIQIPHTGLRGDTPMNERRRQVEAFNNEADIKVFCASLLAGGTGIDLTGAQAVIHYDRWWNAAKEEQATSRVHRFGQQQAVQVFKFITAGTLEEKLHQLISKKQTLAEDAIQCDDGSVIKKLSRSEIASILQWNPN